MTLKFEIEIELMLNLTSIMGLPAAPIVMFGPWPLKMDLKLIADPMGITNDPGHGTHPEADDFCIDSKFKLLNLG